MAENSTLTFLAGGGEMGERIRTFDWATTAVGIPQDWPQSLRTTVRMMLDSRFAMWMAWGPDLTFFCNDAYLPTVGLKRDWVLGARSDRVWEEIWHDIGPRIEHVLQTGAATWDEGLQLFLRRSGYDEETYHTFSYSPVYNEANHVSGMLCVVVEVTERVISERRLHLLRELATVSVADSPSVESAGKVLLDTVAKGPFDVPFAALYVAARANAYRLAGATLSPTTGNIPETSRPEDMTCDLNRAVAMRESQQLDLGSHGIELAGPWQETLRGALVVPLCTSGNTQTLGCLVMAVSTRRQLDEAYRGFLGLVADQFASKLSDVQSRLDTEARAESLAELDRAKNVFFSNVSHELRTPLTLLLGPLNDLLAGDALTPETRRALDLAQRNGLRLKKLVNSLLDFSRIEAGRADTRFQATDLAAYTVDLASLFRSAIEGAGLTLHVRVDTGLPPVYVDRDMWEKVVLNLLSNAFKFTFEGGVDVSLSRAGESVQLVVKDTGIGIQRADLSRVFERFQRVAGTRSRVAEGTGIGLALVKELVRLHSGTVSAESEWGKGTAFTVTLPLGYAHLPAERLNVEVTEAHATVTSESLLDDTLGSDNSTFRNAFADPAPLVASPSFHRKGRLLVVDDNADMRAYLARLLGPFWTVELACDGVQALAALARQRPDLVITDVMMPNMDGFELIDEIRSQTESEYLPVIVLSARAGDEARVAGLHQGADDYLVKPFSTPELLARVEVQLMRSRVRRAEEANNKRLADLFREAPVGVALLRGPDHIYEAANPVHVAFHSGRPLLGLPYRVALPEMVEQGVVALLDRVYETGEPYKGQTFPVEILNPVTGRREKRFFEFVMQPLTATGLDERSIAVVGVDVSDLVEARLIAEEASRVKDEFMAVLGHELRNPLAPIFAAVQLMKRRYEDVAVRERDIILRQARHMARLVDDLMDIARITRGNLTLQRELIEIAMVVQKAVETTAPLFQDRQQVLRLEGAPGTTQVYGDETRLCQVISNLLVNASKFSPKAGVVTLRVTTEGDTAVLRVIDNGIGMDSDELGTVFDSFAQGKQALHRPRGGLGLGLAIARNLVRLHDGTLTAESAGPGLGSEFKLVLPLAEGAAKWQACAAPVASTPSRSYRVLVVDDNLDAGTSIAELLRELGHQVLLAEDAASALNLMQAHEGVDAALLDIGLPGMDGYELAERLRALEAFRGARLVALTGFGQASDALRSRERGFHAHLVKPVELSQLLQAIEGDADPVAH